MNLMKEDGLIEILKALLGFLDQNLWSLAIIILLIISRKDIAGLIQRIIKLNFSYGGASGGMEAAAPNTVSDDESRIKIEKLSPPTTAEPEPVELKEKEEKVTGWLPRIQDALNTGDTDTATQVFEAHQREEKDADIRFFNEAIFLHFLYIKGNDRTALSRLEKLHARGVNEKQIQFSAFWLSSCYEAIKDYDKAIKLWQEAISNIIDKSLKTACIINLAKVYNNKGENNLGIELIEERLVQVIEQEQRANLYQMLSTLEKEKGDSHAAALALEKVVELSPGNNEVIFDAAFTQSQEKLQLLSLINYSTLLKRNERHASALNNLAVCASEFKFSAKQVELFQQAVNEKNTLAMANLANLLIEGGFWEEAKEILDKARVMDDPHENVGEALYRLQILKNEQEEKWSALIKKADAFQRKIRMYGEAFFDRAATSTDYSGLWFTKRGEEVAIKINGQRITGEWIESQAAGLHSLYQHSSNLAVSTLKCSISGTQRNRSAMIEYQRRPELEVQPTLLGGFLHTSIKCYSYFSADKQLWEFFSLEPEKEFTLTLYRKAPKAS